MTDIMIDAHMRNITFLLNNISSNPKIIVDKFPLKPGKINDMMKSYAKSKRIRGIIYSNPTVDEILIPNLFNTLDELDNISEMVLMDDYYVPKLKHLYKYFDEVIFFPSVKKTRLIECKSIDKPVGWKE